MHLFSSPSLKRLLVFPSASKFTSNDNFRLLKKTKLSTFLSQYPRQTSALHFQPSHAFFMNQLFRTEQTPQEKIAKLELLIHSNDPNQSSQELHQHIQSLIELKRTHFNSNFYAGFASDLLKQSNALFTLGQTSQAISLLVQCESHINSLLETRRHTLQLKSLDETAETKSLNLELADCILMRLQMADSSCSHSTLNALLTSCQHAIQILTSNGEKHSEHMAIAYQVNAEIYYRLGDIEHTARALEEAVGLLSSLLEQQSNQSHSHQGDDNMSNLLVRYAGCLETLGNLHFDLRNFRQAQDYLTTAIKIWHKRLNLGKINQKADASHSEMQVHHQLQLSQNQSHLYLRCLNSLGTFYTCSGWTVKAQEILEEAQENNAEILRSDPDGHAWLLLNLAKAHYSRENFSESLRKTEQAEWRIRNEMNGRLLTNGERREFDMRYRRSLAQILEHKSALLTMQGNHNESILAVEEGIRLFESEESYEPIFCRLLFARAMQYLHAANYDRAIELAAISQNIVESTRGKNDTQVADALRVTGIAFCEKAMSPKFQEEGKYKIDEALFSKGIRNLDRALVILQDNRSNNHVKEEVEEELEQQNFTARLQDVQAILNDIANLYEAKKDFKSAIARLESMRFVRTQLLQLNGRSSELDGIIINTDAKIAALYQHILPLSSS